MKALNILPSLSFLIVILLFAESCTNEKDVEPVSTNRLYVCYIEKSSENEKKPSSDIFITQQLNDTIQYGMCFGNKTRTINNNFDFTVSNIINELNLKNPIYAKTASYGHFGRDEFPWEKIKQLNS